MSDDDFRAIYGDLIDLGLIVEEALRTWRVTAKGCRIAQKVILTVLASPNDGTEREIESLELSVEILRDLARGMEAK